MPAYRLSIIAAAAALGLAATGQAQTPPSPPPGAMPPHGEGMARMAERREMHTQARIQALHDALNVRPEQETAFQAYTASMRPDHPGGWRKDHEGGPGGAGHAPAMAMAGPMTTPDRLDTMLKRFDERTTHMREALAKRTEAVKTFYAVLSPDQKRVFDALPMLSGRGMGRMGGHMGRPGGMAQGEDMGSDQQGLGE